MNKNAGKYKKISAGICFIGFLVCNLAIAQVQEIDAEPIVEKATENEITQTVATPSSIPTSTPIAAPQRPVAVVSQAPKINSGASLLNLAFGLLLILALIFALAWLVRRMGQGGLLTNNQIKVVAAMPLGTRERLLVVDVGGQQLLLGITATQINTLHVFAEPIIDKQEAMGQSDFGKKLMAILQQKTTQEKPAQQPQSDTESRL